MCRRLSIDRSIIQYDEAIFAFDLERGPLLRAQLLRLDQQDHVLLLNMHHIVSDGWSAAIFIAELQTFYNAGSGPGPSPLPPLLCQYADYAIWQRDWLQGEALQHQLNYWSGQGGDNDFSIRRGRSCACICFGWVYKTISCS